MVNPEPDDERPPVANGESVWRDRAIERSTGAVRARAATRVQQLLEAARAIVTEKDSIEFTVQEVVERSGLSLRSFYQYFDGKHELLLALFEEEVAVAIGNVKSASNDGDPLDRLEEAVKVLYELSAPDPSSNRPLFFEFSNRLALSHPDEITAAYVPMFEYIVSLVESAADAGLLRPGRPRRIASIVLHTATTIASRTMTARQHITADEVWAFCLRAIAPDEVTEPRLAALTEA